MGGKEASRGFLYQGFASVLEALTDKNKWDKIYIEFPTSNDKVDIALGAANKVIKSIQVKSTINTFSKSDIGLDDTYKVLADFGDAVLAGQLGKKGARFVTWEWDFDRQGVHAGHYHMENYDAAKLDFAARAGLINEQRLFSDEQLAVIRNACEFALEADATLSYREEKQLQSVQEQIELLLPQQEQEQRPTMEQTM